MPPSRRSLVLLWLSSSATAFVAQPRTRPAARAFATNAPRTWPTRSTTRSTALNANAIDEDAISDFCKGTNAFWKQLIIPVVRDYADVKPKGTADVDDFFSVVTAAPETPGIPRPVWLTIAASVPTGLIWYGWYKFSVEEELFQYELETEGRVSGCGGYGTLFPFVFGVIIGGPLALVGFPGGDAILEAAGLWILLGQVNLYRRVNECFPKGEEPLHAWWALLPPPLDVVVGLRQVHYLSEYWKQERGMAPGGDAVAEKYFPFISAPRFTLKEFARTPSMWFWFTKDWDDFDVPLLKD